MQSVEPLRPARRRNKHLGALNARDSGILHSVMSAAVNGQVAPPGGVAGRDIGVPRARILHGAGSLPLVILYAFFVEHYVAAISGAVKE